MKWHKWSDEITEEARHYLQSLLISIKLLAWYLNLKQLESWKSVFLFINSTNQACCVVCSDSLKLTTSKRYVQVNEFCEFLGWSNDHSWNWTIIDELWLCSSCALDFILRSRWPEDVKTIKETSEFLAVFSYVKNGTLFSLITKNWMLFSNNRSLSGIFQFVFEPLWIIDRHIRFHCTNLLDPWPDHVSSRSLAASGSRITIVICHVTRST